MIDDLLISPHPDDDVIGPGGTIVHRVNSGKRVKIVHVTLGDAGSLTYSKRRLGRMREKEALAADRVLGVAPEDVIFLRMLDGYVEYNSKNIRLFTTLIRRERPRRVYVPHAADVHKDHMKTHELVVEAIRRAAGPWFQECKGKPWAVGTVLGYEVWTPLQHVTYAEDITDVMDTKLEALRQHKSQITDIQYDEGVQGLNRYRGVMTGKGEYCECFDVVQVSKLVK